MFLSHAAIPPTRIRTGLFLTTYSSLHACFHCHGLGAGNARHSQLRPAGIWTFFACRHCLYLQALTFGRITYLSYIPSSGLTMEPL